MNEPLNVTSVIAASEQTDDPWLEVVRRHEAFLARRREAADLEVGAGPTGASLFWLRNTEEQDQAA